MDKQVLGSPRFVHKAGATAGLAGRVCGFGGPGWMLTHPSRLASLLLGDCADVGLAGLQRDQPPVTFVGDGDNSLSMRSVKLGSMGAMYHDSGAGGFSQPTVTTRAGKGSGVDKD